MPRATELDRLLRECSFPSIAIHSGLAQDERIKRYQQFKDFEKRILVATDIFGRGIDVVCFGSRQSHQLWLTLLMRAGTGEHCHQVDSEVLLCFAQI